MEIYLLRHGDYLPAIRDPEEGLSPTGRAQAVAAARGLLEVAGPPAALVASPKTRAQQTAHEAGAVLGFPVGEIQTSPLLKPGAQPEDTVDLLLGLGAERVLAVGHLPNLALVAAQLLTGGRGVEVVFQTGTLAGLHLPSPASALARLVFLLPGSSA